MTKTIANKHERCAALEQLLITAGIVGAQVSDVKRDETVFVRLLSTERVSAVEQAEVLGQFLMDANIDFTQVDDVRIRMKLP